MFDKSLLEVQVEKDPGVIVTNYLNYVKQCLDAYDRANNVLFHSQKYKAQN